MNKLAVFIFLLLLSVVSFAQNETEESDAAEATTQDAVSDADNRSLPPDSMSIRSDREHCIADNPNKSTPLICLPRERPATCSPESWHRLQHSGAFKRC